MLVTKIIVNFSKLLKVLVKADKVLFSTLYNLLKLKIVLEVLVYLVKLIVSLSISFRRFRRLEQRIVIKVSNRKTDTKI